MEKKQWPWLKAAFLLNVLIVVGSLCALFAGKSMVTTAQVMAIDVFFTILMCVIAMAVSLKRSLSVTLYDYKNIGLIAGILFGCILEITLFTEFFECLKNQRTPAQLYQAMLTFPREFSYYTVLVIFAIGLLLCISNVALIRHEGFHLYNALGILLVVFYVSGTVICYWLSDLFAAHRASLPAALQTAGTVMDLFLLLMLCYFECIFVGAAILGFKAAKHVPSFDKDYIVILGCSIDKRGGLLPLLKGRVNRAMRFAWQQEIATGKPLKYVPSGGQGANEIMSEGSAMEMYLLSKGAEQDEVFPEKSSVNTFENFRLSKEIIDGLNPDAKVAFATTNYHVLRSGILARRAGVEAEGIAGDTKWYFWPNGFIREFFAILTLEKRAHIATGTGLFILSSLVGIVGYCGNMM